MNTFIKKNWLRLLGIVMLLVAVVSYFSRLYSLPYAFYQLMCWVVVVESLLIVWQTHKSKELLYIPWVFALVAIVFNPITPIYLSTIVWQFADIAVIVLFLLFSFFSSPFPLFSFLVKEK